MIIFIEDKKLKKITIGRSSTRTGEIFCPYFWGSNEIEKFINSLENYSKFKINKIDPETEFELLEIK